MVACIQTAGNWSAVAVPDELNVRRMAHDSRAPSTRRSQSSDATDDSATPATDTALAFAAATTPPVGNTMSPPALVRLVPEPGCAPHAGAAAAESRFTVHAPPGSPARLSANESALTHVPRGETCSVTESRSLAIVTSTPTA